MAKQLTEGEAKGLEFIQQYRYLTIDQFMKVAGSSKSRAYKVLADQSNQKNLGFLGGSPKKTPGKGSPLKHYFLTEKGYNRLLEWGVSETSLGPFRRVKEESQFTDKMYHRRKLVDTLIAVELSINKYPNHSIKHVFYENRMEAVAGGGFRSEMTDYTGEEENTETKIIPDGAFILHSHHSNTDHLFFVELDTKTEVILSSKDNQSSLLAKYRKYLKYLNSGKFVSKYSSYGNFDHFHMLMVTLPVKRAVNIRQKMDWLKNKQGEYFYVSSLPQVSTDFFGRHWYSFNSNKFQTLIS